MVYLHIFLRGIICAISLEGDVMDVVEAHNCHGNVKQQFSHSTTLLQLQ
jgi:hypothetical protein